MENLLILKKWAKRFVENPLRRFDDNSKDKYDRNSCGTSSSTSGSSQNYCKEHEDEIITEAKKKELNY